jgi:hypothetical protein
MLVMHAAVARPPAGIGEHRSPIGTPPPVGVASDKYSFMAVQADGTTPVAWDPCRPIHYVVNSAEEVDHGAQLLQQAINRVSHATGLHFIDDGTTDELPVPYREAYQPLRYGDRWAPVLIAWTDPTAIPDLQGDVIGLGGPTPYTGDGPNDPTIDVSGIVYLDSPQIRTDGQKYGDGADMTRALMMHELGHLVGLGHVSDTTQIMNPFLVPGTTSYGVGDLDGLAKLGEGRCDPKV